MTMTMKDHSQIKVLDCTFRDGGYYNNWEFEPKLVQEYLKALPSSGIDIIEIGFRFTPKDRFYGPFAYTTDEFLETLDLPDNVELGVMVNASDPLADPDGDVACINKLFRPRSQSRISLVRVAAHVHQVEKCGPMTRALKDLGYSVGFNIMQSNVCTDEQLGQLAEKIGAFGSVDALYFADSLGNMESADIRRVVGVLKAHWQGPLGFHGHDNIGQGLSNTLVAIEEGVTWLDATVRGMGRGAGNTQIEYLMTELVRKGLRDCSLDSLYTLVCGDFEALQKHYDWGRNIFYYLAGQKNVHPTYVQDMLTQDGLDSADVLAVIDVLGSNGGLSYKAAGVASAIASRFKQAAGRWDVSDWAQGRSALVIAGGSAARRYSKELAAYIRKNRPVVICLNYVDFIPPELVSAYASCHPARILSISENLVAAKRPLITPRAALPDALLARLPGVEILDYGMKVEGGVFEAGKLGATVASPLIASYIFGMLAEAGAKEILLAGFDGYDGNSEKYQEMAKQLDLFNARYPALPLISITPSRYPLKQRSMYVLH